MLFAKFYGHVGGADEVARRVVDAYPLQPCGATDADKVGRADGSRVIVCGDSPILSELSVALSV